ncbi:hypothetical protein BLS_009235 [Venturia inaequalis]|uniref:RING-type domain-containing protein n=1 Tax=Venturia inaequalis TaxID=5025 RepID=A0A8H3V4Y9_VENIN|nr:hypothetical protein BLS_009235 [Venturia inaequalis]KAE9981480.1 hypothetical protein EG327_006216 [Venturia inaequalis]RDI84903.1 hypothetical protein Vi05172_g5031 [Venturia inaequalis]
MFGATRQSADEGGTPATPSDPGLAGFRALKECVLCNDRVELEDVEKLPCGRHYVCRKGCLPEFFENAIAMQSLYPPKCCHMMFDIGKYEHLLTVDLIARYLEKAQEYHTDPRLRRYCPEDNTFLPPESYEDHGDNKETTIARCKECSQSTCISCTELAEPPSFVHDCKPKKVETNKEYSNENRFKGCPFCGRLGILPDACNHTTCSCGGEWCFICLEPLDNSHNHDDCKEYGDPEYDEEGYDDRNFHRDTGFDRDGYTRAGYNIRGLNRQGERMQGFADRVRSHKESEEHGWMQEWMHAHTLSQADFQTFVTQLFARYHNDREALARYGVWVRRNDMLDLGDVRLLSRIRPDQDGEFAPIRSETPAPIERGTPGPVRRRGMLAPVQRGMLAPVQRGMPAPVQGRRARIGPGTPGPFMRRGTHGPVRRDTPEPDLDSDNDGSDDTNFSIRGPSQVQRSCQHSFTQFLGTRLCGISRPTSNRTGQWIKVRKGSSAAKSRKWG